jgi:hypothetical protein
MTINDQIRKTLRYAGEPLTLDQLAEANNWDADDKRQAGKNLCVLRKNGEVETSMSEGRVCYGLVAGYKPKQKMRGPGIQYGNGEGARAEARPVVANSFARSTKTIDVSTDVARDRVEVAVPDWNATSPRDRLIAEQRAASLASHKIEVTISGPAFRMLGKLVARGFHGADPADAMQRLVYRALEALQP